MKFKINRRWRHWKNDDAHARRAVVGSEGESVKIAAPRSANDITPSSKGLKRSFSPAKPNATSDKIYGSVSAPKCLLERKSFFGFVFISIQH